MKDGSVVRMSGRLRIFRMEFMTLLVMVALVPAFGCYTKVPTFELVDNGSSVRPGSIAVISGTNTAFNLALAEAVTSELKRLSRLVVMDQAWIKERLKNYPADIITVDRESELARSSNYWFGPSDLERIAGFQKQLKADYILVVWSDQIGWFSQIGGLSIARQQLVGNIHTRLFEFPSRKIIGYSGYARREPASMFRKGDQEVFAKFIDSAAKATVEEMVQLTRLQKQEAR